MEPNKSEAKEQAEFVQWCREQGHKVCATAQSTYTTSWKAINLNTTLGVVKGLPDVIVVVNEKYRANKKPLLVFVEMKRRFGGTVSKEQKEWIAILGKCPGVKARVCRGAFDAVEYISNFMEIEPEPDDSFIKSLK